MCSLPASTPPVPAQGVVERAEPAVHPILREPLAYLTLGIKGETLKSLREALEDAEETLRLVEHPAIRDPQYGDEVEALGRRIGFGALMSSASASWRDVHGVKGGEFVAGPCYGTVVATLAKIRAALSSQGSRSDDR